MSLNGRLALEANEEEESSSFRSWSVGRLSLASILCSALWFGEDLTDSSDSLAVSFDPLSFDGFLCICNEMTKFS